MSSRRRVYASKPNNVSHNHSVAAHFDDIMSSARYTKVDPHSCIPFTRFRKPSSSGVARLMRIFDGELQEKLGNEISTEPDASHCGISLGTGTAILVELSGSMSHYVNDYFRSEGFSMEEAREKANSRDRWYGIVDGEHSQRSIVKLMSLHERWVGFQWFVTVIDGGHPFERYKQLAISNNAKHDAKFYVELTMYDRISNLKAEHLRLVSCGGRVTGSDVSKAYSGMNGKQNRTLVQIANVVMRLSTKVIDEIGIIVNGEHPNICLSDNNLPTRGARTIQDVMELVDCRVYRNFITIYALKASTVFMNATEPDGITAQLYTLHRSKFICRENNFKTVKHETVTEQFKVVQFALSEEKTFLHFLDPEPWPKEMENMRTNLLKTTIFDKELKENAGSENVLSSLFETYKTHFPITAKQKLVKFQAARQLKEKQTEQNSKRDRDPKSSSASNGSANASQSASEAGENKDSTNIHKLKDKETKSIDDKSTKPSERHAESENDKDAGSNSEQIDSDGSNKPEETGRGHPVSEGTSRDGAAVKKGKKKEVKDVEEDPDETLKYFNILHCNMTWQSYTQKHHDDEDLTEQVDALITEPTSAPSRSFIRQYSGQRIQTEEIETEEVAEFPNFAKRVLKTGGYCLLFIPIFMFQEWYESFAKSGFSVMSSPYTVNYDETTVPKRKVNEFPQIMTEFVLIAKAPGKHPDGFQPTFETSFNMIKSNSTRRRSCVDNVPAVRHKLFKENSRSPYRTTEKPVGLIAELVDLFTPVGGSVIDPYAGTLSTGIAAMRTHRKCLLIEKDRACYKAAVERLRLIGNLLHRNIRLHNKKIDYEEVIFIGISTGQSNPELKFEESVPDDPNGEVDKKQQFSKNKTIKSDKNTINEAKLIEYGKGDEQYQAAVSEDESCAQSAKDGFQDESMVETESPVANSQTNPTFNNVTDKREEIDNVHGEQPPTAEAGISPIVSDPLSLLAGVCDSEQPDVYGRKIGRKKRVHFKIAKTVTRENISTHKKQRSHYSESTENKNKKPYNEAVVKHLMRNRRNRRL